MRDHVIEAAGDAAKLSIPVGVASAHILGLSVSDWSVVVALIAGALTCVEKIIRIRRLNVSKRGTTSEPA